MGNKQNVLIVHNYYQIPGGEDTVVANEKKMLEDHGHRVVLYTRNNSELKNMRFYQKLLLPFTTIYNPRTVRDIKRIIRDECIDIVHVHNTLSLISPSVYYAALKMKKPVVQTIHNFRLLCPGATFYRNGHICEECVTHGLGCALRYGCYRGSRLQTLICVISTKLHRMTGIYGKINYICLTEFNKEKLLHLKQVRPERVFVKPNFVERTVDFIPEQKRRDQFVFAGRLEKLKGIDILLKAWKQLDNPAPKLILCGTGPLEEWCREFIDKYNLNVELKGFTSNMDVRNLIAESKALILPTQCYEGFPMVIIEAYSVGTPVICGNIGNAGCSVIEDQTGWKYQYNNLEDLSRLLKVPKSLVGADIVRHYTDNYSENINYQKTIAVYESCTALNQQ